MMRISILTQFFSGMSENFTKDYWAPVLKIDILLRLYTSENISSSQERWWECFSCLCFEGISLKIWIALWIFTPENISSSLERYWVSALMTEMALRLHLSYEVEYKLILLALKKIMRIVIIISVLKEIFKQHFCFVTLL